MKSLHVQAEEGVSMTSLEGDVCHVAGTEDTGLGLRQRQVVGDEARQASRGESQG